MTEKALAVAGPLDLEGTKRAMAAFDKFKSEVLTDQDFWVGRDRQGVEMKHIKRSGLMKFLMAINGNAAVTDERSEVIKFENREILVFHFTARATAPNGRFTEAVGSASSDERKFDKPVHDLRALAQTRAVNRAIANLVGGGVVSAEEMENNEEPRRVSSSSQVKPLEQPAYKPRKYPVPVGMEQQNGNEQDSVNLWQGIFKEAGFTEKEVSDNVELEVLDNYRIAIRQKMSFMPEALWKRFMNTVSEQRGIWNKDKRQWEGPC
jgi:hypothetical protein